MSTCRVAVIPAKALAGSKMRLAGVLDDGARRALVLAMLRDVLAACREGGRFAEVVVVAGDDEVARAAEDAHVLAVGEPAGASLNDAIAHGLRYARTLGAEEALVLPADIPQLTASDIDDLLDAASGEQAETVALVRARDGGTNALFLRPPGVIDPAFGPESADAHLAAARARGVAATAVPRPGLAFDVDTPDDLHALDGMAVGAATTAWLARCASGAR